MDYYLTNIDPSQNRYRFYYMYRAEQKYKKYALHGNKYLFDIYHLNNENNEMNICYSFPKTLIGGDSHDLTKFYLKEMVKYINLKSKEKCVTLKSANFYIFIVAETITL